MSGPYETKDEWFNGYAQAVWDYSIHRDGRILTGCLEEPYLDVLVKRWKQRHPECCVIFCSGNGLCDCCSTEHQTKEKNR